MRTQLAILFSLVWLACSAQIPAEVMEWTLLKATNVVEAVSATYLLSEDFEGAGTPSGWVAGGTGSTKDFDFATAPLVGSQSLRIAAATQSGYAQTNVALSEAYVYLVFNAVTLPPSSTFRVLAGFRDGSGSIAVVSLNDAGTLQLTCGYSTNITDAVTAGTTNHLWFHYKKGAGSDAVLDAEWSTTGTKVGSGSKFAVIPNGTSTTDSTVFRLGSSISSTFEFIFDKVRIDDVSIGSNPP